MDIRRADSESMSVTRPEIPNNLVAVTLFVSESSGLGKTPGTRSDASLHGCRHSAHEDYQGFLIRCM